MCVRVCVCAHDVGCFCSLHENDPKRCASEYSVRECVCVFVFICLSGQMVKRKWQFWNKQKSINCKIKINRSTCLVHTRCTKPIVNTRVLVLKVLTFWIGFAVGFSGDTFWFGLTVAPECVPVLHLYRLVHQIIRLGCKYTK